MGSVDRIYAGLGLASYTSATQNSSLSDWWQYNPDKNEWLRKRDFPGQRAQAWSFAIENNIYVGGGMKNVTYEAPPTPFVNTGASVGGRAFFYHVQDDTLSNSLLGYEGADTRVKSRFDVGQAEVGDEENIRIKDPNQAPTYLVNQFWSNRNGPTDDDWVVGRIKEVETYNHMVRYQAANMTPHSFLLADSTDPLAPITLTGTYVKIFKTVVPTQPYYLQLAASYSTLADSQDIWNKLKAVSDTNIPTTRVISSDAQLIWTDLKPYISGKHYVVTEDYFATSPYIPTINAVLTPISPTGGIGHIHGFRFDTNEEAKAYQQSIVNPGLNMPQPPEVPIMPEKSMFKYEPVKDRWLPVYNTPDLTDYEYAYSKAFTVASYAYMGLGNTQKLFKFDPKLQNWSAAATFIGTSRIFLDSFVVGTYAYVGNGYNASYMFNDWYRYSPMENIWTTIPSAIGTFAAYQFSFSANEMGIVGGGFIASSYPQRTYAFIPTLNGWTTIPTFVGTLTAHTAGVEYNATTGYAMFGEDSNSRTGWNYEFNGVTPTWNAKATLPALPRSRAVAEKVTLTTNENFIYFTTGSTTQYPNDCSLWSLQVNNYDEYHGPSWVGTIPIVASSYWAMPSVGANFNSYYPMSLAANSEYVLVSQWHYPASLGDASYGTNLLHIGARDSVSNPYIASWNTQTLWDDTNTAHLPKVNFGANFITDPTTECFYIQSINNKIIRAATITNVGAADNKKYLRIAAPNTIRNPDSTQYNLATYGVLDAEHNISPYARFSDSGLLFRGNGFPNGISAEQLMHVTRYLDSGSVNIDWLPAFTWVKELDNGE